MDIVQPIAVALGASWASGINLYAAVLTLGVLGITGNMVLPPDLQILANPMVIGAAALMYGIEFFADKIPGVDTLWDTLHTFIRIPAGAILAAGAVGDVGMGAELAAALVGGTLAASTHAAKAGTRAVVNTSPEPFSNWTLSIGEDIAVFTGMWAAVKHPWIFIALLIVFIALMVWLLPKMWRGVRRVFRWLFRSKDDSAPARPPDAAAPATSAAAANPESPRPETPSPKAPSDDWKP